MLRILRRDLDHYELFFWALANLLVGVGGRVTSHVFQLKGLHASQNDTQNRYIVPHLLYTLVVTLEY